MPHLTGTPGPSLPWPRNGGDTPYTGCKHAKLALNHGELIAGSQQTLALHLIGYMAI